MSNSFVPDFAGSSSSTAGPSQDVGGHRMGGSNSRQHKHHRMSPYARPPGNTSGLSRRQCPPKVCSTCRSRRIGSQLSCGSCQQDEDNTCDYTDAPEKFVENSDSDSDSGEWENVHDYETTNYGEGSQTYNGSRVHNSRNLNRSSRAVVNVHVHESGSTSRSSSSSSSPFVTPPTSQGTGPNSAPSDSNLKLGRELTRSEQYVSLFLGLGLGYPLWKPIPRRTLEPAEYIISIGDVGIIPDGLPFNTLFNITQPMDSLANKDGIPEGVDPPYILEKRWLTVIDKHHQEGKMLVRPDNSASYKTVQGLDGSREYSFTLTNTQGALLGLPKGSVLTNLEPRTEFKEHIKKYSPQWYNFAEKGGGLEEYQALCIVTGVEQCSTWAIAVWSHAPGDYSDNLSLRLESDGGCSWIHSASRCDTYSLTGPSEVLKQTVFVRGFWINKFSCGMNSAMPPPPPPPPPRPGGQDGGRDDNSHFGGNGGSVNGPSTSTFPSSSTSAPTHSGGHSKNSASHTDAVDHRQEPQVESLSVDCQDFLTFTVESPCELINRFAFAVVSRIKPAVLDTECMVFSHDDEWISIMQESDDGLPTTIEIFRRICSKFKFVVENGSIYTAKLMNHDIDSLIRYSVIPARQAAGGVISVLLEFRDPEPPKPQEESEKPLTVSRNYTPTPTHLHPDTKDERDSFHPEESPPQKSCSIEPSKQEESSSKNSYSVPTTKSNRDKSSSNSPSDDSANDLNKAPDNDLDDDANAAGVQSTTDRTQASMNADFGSDPSAIPPYRHVFTNENDSPEMKLQVAINLHRALVASLVNATRNGDVFLMNLIGGALGGLAKARVIESLKENSPLKEEQEVAVLLCEAVYLFERSFAESRNTLQDPVAAMILSRSKGEDLAKIVIESGLKFLVNPGSFEIRHIQRPYKYFHVKLMDALNRAGIEPPQDIKARVRELLGGAR